MKVQIDAQKFRSADVDLDSLIETISTGKAVLFVGSGFSKNAIALNNEKMPTASALAEAIGTLGGFESDKDLRYASEKFLRENEPATLVDFLHSTFLLKKCEPYQTVISSAPWRRIYTTNYDLCIEESAKANGKRIDTVDLEAQPGDFLAKNDICVHLNGSLRNLTADSLSAGFKLSNSSYLSSDSFVNSAWHYPFKRDLEMCSALVFIGYSLYDIEIQKILYDNPDLSLKTYFVTSPDVSDRQRFTIAPYGQCIPLGTEGFSAVLHEKLPGFLEEYEEDTITSLIEYKIIESDSIPRDADAEKFLLFGDLKDAYFERAMSSADGAPVLIRRFDLSNAVDTATSGHHLAVVSDFGNGKTVFLRSIAFLLAQKGAPVYLVENSDFYNHRDLEILSKVGKRIYLIIDSYDQQIELLQHFSDLSPKNIVLIMAARTPRHEREREKLSSIGIFVDEYIIDELNDTEITEFVDILENVGLWEEGRITLPLHEKKSYIKIKHKSQLQQSLLSILQAPQMRSRVDEIIKSLWEKKSFKDTVFAISVMSALDFPLKPSMISEVAGNDDIYNSALRGNENFKNLFRIERGEVRSRSSIFSLTLIRNHFAPTYVISEVLAIAKRMDDRAGDNKQHREILKSILRFSGVESLFPERQRKNNLVQYYEEVKRRLSWLKHDPHFWLQYGMALLAYDDYTKSQRMLDLAYEWAEKKSNYHTVHIDMVQSRLYLETATKEKAPAESYKLFQKAIDVLRRVPDDDAKFQYLDKIGPLFSSCFATYSKGNKNDFIKSCEILSRDIQSYIDHSQPKGGTERRLNSIRSKLIETIDRAKEMANSQLSSK